MRLVTIVISWFIFGCLGVQLCSAGPAAAHTANPFTRYNSKATIIIFTGYKICFTFTTYGFATSYLSNILRNFSLLDLSTLKIVAKNQFLFFEDHIKARETSRKHCRYRWQNLYMVTRSVILVSPNNNMHNVILILMHSMSVV